MAKSENIPWPGNYYQTFDRLKRKEILMNHMEEGSEPQADTIRLKLWEALYQKRNKMSEETDYFVRGFLGLLSESRITVNLFNQRHEQKLMTEIMKDLCIVPSEYFNAEDYSNKDLVNDLLFQEYCAFASFYLNFSMEDHKYCSAFMGSLSLKKEQVIEKLAKDMKDACVTAPFNFGHTESFEPFKQACRQTFMEEFPEHTSSL